ncbi:hypothetical protein [Pseudoduganella armeniaca]|uniref:Type IV pilus biogenesis protein PilP n=1 Tax=Pseudoduganella armeniaca TaxID=2072590 RepID=A0A2R4CAQ5_9BURK|nr:hypothetical protein [Pseudoduganella armeniaca]AVR96675.1 hypothetical protein C9I28_13985 [Pseudoduganella armeniaca]
MSKVRSAAVLTLLVAAGLAAPARAQMSLTTMGRLFTTPADRMQLDQQRSAALAQGAPATTAPASATAMASTSVPPGMAADSAAAGAAAAPPPPAPVRFGGVLRRSDGQATIWVDDTPRDTVVRGRPGAGVPVDVGGRRVILKPGQSWDPASATIQDVRRGTPAR